MFHTVATFWWSLIHSWLNLCMQNHLETRRTDYTPRNQDICTQGYSQRTISLNLKKSYSITAVTNGIWHVPSVSRREQNGCEVERTGMPALPQCQTGVGIQEWHCCQSMQCSKRRANRNSHTKTYWFYLFDRHREISPILLSTPQTAPVAKAGPGQTWARNSTQVFHVDDRNSMT